MKDKVVVIQFPTWSYDLCTLQDQFQGITDFLKEKGYDWDLLLIPRDCDWCEMSYQELKNIRDTINLVLEDKRNDINNEARTGIETGGETI